MKVGFDLLPVALEGLGGITHLINMETVEDLIVLMRGILESNPPAPELIQLLKSPDPPKPYPGAKSILRWETNMVSK